MFYNTVVLRDTFFAGKVICDIFEINLEAISLFRRMCNRPNTGGVGVEHISPGPQRCLADPRITKAIKLIDEAPLRKWTLATLSRECFLSPTHFRRLFRRATGTSLNLYLNAARIDRAKRLLCQPTLSTKEIAARSGFSTSSHFCAAFHAAVGVTPGTFRTTQLKRTQSSDSRR
jgi:AraC-like DNA-binding protein